MTRSFLHIAACALSLLLSVTALARNDAVVAPNSPQSSFGAWGIDLEQLDPSIDPGDDFFAYVNAKWIAANPIPAEHARYGAFTMLNEKSQADIRALIDELRAAEHRPSSIEARIVASYEAYLDQDAIDAAGLAPARPYLDNIAKAGSREALARLFGMAGYPAPFGAWVMVDANQPDRYIVGLASGGLGLPDRDYYLREDEKSRKIQAAYRDYLAYLLGLAGYDNPAGMALSVYELEYKFAVIDWDRTVLRNRDLTYNKLARADLDRMAGAFPLTITLDTMGLGTVEDYVVWQLPPDGEEAGRLGLSDAELDGIGGGVPAMFALLSETPLETLKAWMAAHFISDHADVLPSEVDRADFELYGKLLRGQEEQRPRWKRAIDTAESQLGEALGKTYVARHFPPQNKAAMEELVANLKKAMAQSLADNSWMSEATKREAAAKLAAFTSKIGYPEEFETYEGLEIRPEDPLANSVAAQEWAWKDQLAKLDGPIDRKEWLMLPQTVNAYYNSSTNEIVFPAAILQPPFFNASADPAVNYGAIGAVIGHEIGHGFDDQGAKSDGTGLIRNWWSEEDSAAFAELGDKLAAQYDAYCPLDEGQTCVNGRFTLGENIGDLGGLSLAYRAWRLSLNGQEPPVIDGFTGDQRFFLAWAQVWRAANREEALRQRLVTDPHSPEQFRVNGVVRNMDAWYEAFDVTSDDALYLPPGKRINIW